MANYDYLDQNIVATTLIQAYNNDSFYNPTTNNHYGFAADGTLYLNGIQQLVGSPPTNPIYASWYLELANPSVCAVTQGPQPSRDFQAAFPAYGLILLSPVAMTIVEQSTPVPQADQLRMWMTFGLADQYMMSNNYAAFLPTPALAVQGFTPSGLSYADGIISIIYTPDAGNQAPAIIDGSPPAPGIPVSGDSSQSHMVVNIDFAQDLAYLDVAL
jgi:hypothetical protein